MSGSKKRERGVGENVRIQECVRETGVREKERDRGGREKDKKRFR